MFSRHSNSKLAYDMIVRYCGTGVHNILGYGGFTTTVNVKSSSTWMRLLNYQLIHWQLVRGFKSDLKIKWVRPPKISCIKPEKSGDLQPVPAVDSEQFPIEFQSSKELQEADELVKRVFSLKFSPRNKSMKIVRKDLVNNVKRHTLDKYSAEARIAAMTGGIRDLQAHMEQFPRDKIAKVHLKELIDKRKKFLKYLRRWDYKRFEWILEKLDLIYRPPPSYFHWVTRKESLCKLTDKYCADLKQERLDAYKRSLEAQKEDFLQEKADKFKWIVEEERACGMEPTVSQNDIDQVLKQLEELKISREIRTKEMTGL